MKELEVSIYDYYLYILLISRVSFFRRPIPDQLIHLLCFIPFDSAVNGLGAPSVLPPFALGLGTPLTATGAYGNGIPSLGAFALTTTAGIGQTNPASLRGFSNVLLVSNLNEEVSEHVQGSFSQTTPDSRKDPNPQQLTTIYSSRCCCPKPTQNDTRKWNHLRESI